MMLMATIVATLPQLVSPARHVRCVQRALSPMATASPAAGSSPAAPLPPLPDGVLLLDKPTGWTSFDCVGKVRNTLERHYKRLGHRFGRRSRLKVGHGGTLDPMATGMLLVGVGGGCRRLQSYLQGAKAYEARAQLGRETDTQDSEGTTLRTAPFEHLSLSELERATSLFTGSILQRPPIYSALRKDGKRLYELARAGAIEPEEVEARRVTVHHLSLEAVDLEAGTFDLNIRCSGGTYVRSLIVDIARELGSAAHMVELRRTRHGPFCAAETVAAAIASGEDQAELLVPMRPVTVEEFGEASKLLEAIDEAAAAERSAAAATASS